jgi:hypothetical protein
LAAPDRFEIAPITVVSPVPRLWAWWLRATWPTANRGLWIKRPLLHLKFIHIAHWGLIDRLPAAAGRRRARRLPTPYIVFQSNFDGPATEYAEAFALEMPWRIRGLWGAAYGFPGPLPSNDFVEYVLDHAVHEAYHYHARYPTGTVRTVGAALRLEESFERFRHDTKDLGPEAFAAAWREFLTSEQHNL